MKRVLIATAVGLLFSTAALAEPCMAEKGERNPHGAAPGMTGGGMMGGGMMGSGMMGGGMMGGGMMGGMGSAMMGPHAFEGLDLTAEQRKKVEGILAESRRKQFKAMEEMHELAWKQADAAPGKFDEAAARKSFDAHQNLHKQMFESGLETRKQLEAVLTPEQRDKLGRRMGPG